MGKTLSPDLQIGLNQIVAMINCIKSRPMRSRIFAQLCKNLEAYYIALLLHTEVRWLSHDKVLLRFLN